MEDLKVLVYMNVPAGATVESGANEKTAPTEEGLYSLYELADENHNHSGWKWELQDAPKADGKVRYYWYVSGKFYEVGNDADKGIVYNEENK